MPEVISQEDKSTIQQQAAIMVDSSDDSDNDLVQTKMAMGECWVRSCRQFRMNIG